MSTEEDQHLPDERRQRIYEGLRERSPEAAGYY